MSEQMNLFALPSDAPASEVPSNQTQPQEQTQAQTQVENQAPEPTKADSEFSSSQAIVQPDEQATPAHETEAMGVQAEEDSKEPGFLAGLNERQREAVLTPANEALQVLAGAGTGKTELISRRFIKLVKDFRAAGTACPEDRILVVTFTSDAAQGMRERIHQRLLSNGEDGLGPDSWISTFHQFAMRLLRSHPLEVALPPDFVTLNSLEQQVLFNRVVHGVLNGDAADISPVLQQQGLDLPGQLLSLDVLQAEGMADLENLLEPGRLYRLINRIKTAGLSPREFVRLAIEQGQALSRRLQALPVPHDRDAGALDNVLAKVQAWTDSLSPWAHVDWNPARDAERKAESTGKKLTPGLYKDEVKGLAELYLMPRTFEPASPDFALLETAERQEETLTRIVGAIYALYQDALLSQGACDFDDLINHAIRLLETYPALRERYRERFLAIIVDEFQDSNGSQLRLLELLVRDGASNLTVVGDEKQSIYGFRFAQPENLDLIFRHGPFKRVSLQTNYRSRPPVLAVANRLTDSLTERPGQHLHASEANAAGADMPAVTWLNLDGDGSIEEQRALEAHYIAVEIARLVQAGEAKFSDIAVLVKSHGKAEAIQQALADLNIPAIRQKNLGFFQEAVIKDAMALLRLMRNLGDDLSMVRILQNRLNQKQLRDLMRLRRQLHQSDEAANLFETCLLLATEPERLPDWSPVIAAAVGDLAMQLLESRRLKPRLSPVQLFLGLAETVGIIQANTPEWRQKQQRISLHLFERLLYLFGQSRPLLPTLDEVIEILEQYADNPNQELPVREVLGGEDAVRIMTVYAAKGLEFPVVFAAYSELGRVRSSDDSLLLFDPQYAGKAGFGLMLGRVDGLPNLKRDVYQRAWVYPRARTEAQRVFYVALTRAKERLYVVRCQQSFPWTHPDDFPPDALAVYSENEDGDHLFAEYWNADRDALRQDMSDRQERAKAARLD